MTYITGIDQLIGNTPLIDLSTMSPTDTRILGKYEAANPGGSVKDRLAKAMLDDAEAQGLIGPDTILVEPTSGNTGIGLAMLAAARGYHLVLTMPGTMSIERRRLLAAYGAEVVLTEGAKGMPGAIAKAAEMVAENKNVISLKQFENPANPRVHFETTGPEIWEATEGKIDAFVAGVGTGGTVSGAGSFLKSKNPEIRVVAVEPAESQVLSGGPAGPHKIQGIGAGFIPKTLDTKVYDEILPIATDDAFTTQADLARQMGVLAGISSGAALRGAQELAARPEFAGKTIVVILPDTGERYLSMM